ncbi:MAG TPA: D-glycero-beta-D-manno-heptose-7-phosphate kinase [Pyrinomonadaceae bacterium]|nr:D-glycero-beta-D-manno-heptose-7-phosphate kinase [Pyrinomonadaceae bacterium]
MHDTQLQLKILNQISKANVLVIGDVMLDRYWMGMASRLSPEAPVPIVALNHVRNIPGGAANVAANIAGLGGNAALAGVTGSDDQGASLRSALADRGISTRDLVISTSRQTTTKTRVLVSNQQIARVDDETCVPLAGKDEDMLCEAIWAGIVTADAIVLSDYAKGCLTPRVLSISIDAARSSGKPVIVDPKARDLKYYNGATLLTPNLSEALDAAGIGGRDENRAGEAAAFILDSVDIDALLITLGEHGMKLFRRGEAELHFPSVARQVFDVTGAGDTVVAVLSAAMAAGADLRSAIPLANLAAGIAVEKVGTSVVALDELKDAIHDQELHLSAES